MKFALTALIGGGEKLINQCTFLFLAPSMQEDGAAEGRIRKLSVGQYDNDVPGQPLYNRLGWMKSPAADQAVNPGSPIPVGKTKEVKDEEFVMTCFLKQWPTGGASSCSVAKVPMKQLGSCIVAVRNSNDCSYLRDAIQCLWMSCSCPLCVSSCFQWSRISLLQ